MQQQEFETIHRKWIADLRSGEFVQGREFLEYDGTYCCLGVLAKTNGVPIDEITGQETDTINDLFYEEKVVEEYANLIHDMGLNSILANYNDGANGWLSNLEEMIGKDEFNRTDRSFDEIANILEKLEPKMWEYYQNNL